LPVYSSFQIAKKFIHYYVRALNGSGHGMHSPFVFDFILNVLNNSHQYAVPKEVEQLRKELLHDGTTTRIKDLGAGSRSTSGSERKIKDIARSALKPPRYGQLLYRLAKHYHPKNIIELGTSLGITTAYFSKAVPGARIFSIEGSEAIAARAKKNWEKLGCENIQLLEGNFDEVLPSIIPGAAPVDLAFIDGNHRYEPTINYFLQLLKASHNDTILVFDDIHWSEEMERAWEEISKHPSVKCSVDIFYLGFVFFRNEFKAPQHFTIRF
jgi:predicted O-methyltransferase YrrM